MGSKDKEHGPRLVSKPEKKIINKVKGPGFDKP